jgi:hypothetical protein
VANNKKLKPNIAFKRLQQKHEFSDYKLAKFIERFWESKWPLDYFAQGKTQVQIIQQEQLPWLVKVMQHQMPERQRSIEKKFNIHIKQQDKELKKLFKEMLQHKEAKLDSDRERAAKLVQLFIDEFNSKSDPAGTTHRNVSVRYDYQIEKIPKWIKWSDKKILKNAFEILGEIRSILVRRDEIRKGHINYNGQIYLSDNNPLGLRHPACINRQCRDHYPVVKKPFPEVLKIGTKKWSDEEAFKKYKKAALRRKSNELITKQAIEKAWNSLTEGNENE